MKFAFAINAGGDGLVFISDREKGIDISTNEVFPRAAHSHCVYHIAKNVKVRYKTSLKGLLFKAANALNKKAFNDTIAEMKRVHLAAGLYVEDIEPKKMGTFTFSSPSSWAHNIKQSGVDVFERRRDKMRQ